MKHRIVSSLLTGWLLAHAANLSADTVMVPGDAATIQAGIDMASDGDVVLVADGTYVENIDFKGKAVTVSSVNGPGAAVIDGSASAPTVRFNSGETAGSVISGFTIRNGLGGGIAIGGASPIVRGNTITQNVSDFGGGGIAVSGGAPLIEDNFITANQASNGNGMELSSTAAIVRRNTITLNTRGPGSGGVGGGGISVVGSGTAQILENVIAENSTDTDGGGISLFAAGTPTIRGNVIRDNSASSGGGISHANFSDSLIAQNLIVGNVADEGGGIEWLVPSGDRGPRLVNNTIAFNDAPTGSGLFADGFDANAELYNNIIVALDGQTAVEIGNFNDPNAPKFFANNLYSDGGDAYAGDGVDPTGTDGNISFDAMFVDVAGGDFRLLPLSALIDAGTNAAPDLPAFDFEGQTRVLDGNGDLLAVVDIGAFELVPEPSTAALFALGCLGIAAARVASRRRKRAASVRR